MPHRFPWAPRRLLNGRVFRLPLHTADPDPQTDFGPCRLLDRRYCRRDQAWYFYLQAPFGPTDLTLTATGPNGKAEAAVQVRSLDQLRRPHRFNGADWPRRWPLGQEWQTTKRRQTLDDDPTGRSDAEAVAWWLSLDPQTLWAQLPPAELPRAHFVNVHQGCPSCGTAVFRHGGFYPWLRSHRPCDFGSRCPACQARFPSNDLAAGDFTGGAHPDDGYGYFDAEGHIFLFAATYHRDQARAFGAGIEHLESALRAGHPTHPPEAIARRLGLMLLRYALEETYLAAVPQFRYGPSEAVELPWDWGQTDWAAAADPVAALHRKGSVRYCIDLPYISEILARAYDAAWPYLGRDEALVDQATACGLALDGPQAAVGLIEEMLACLVQAAIDGASSSNRPRVSQGVLTLLRALDRPDAADVLDWLYDVGPDRLRTFHTNHFFPDGTPFESAGNYNNIHSNGLFALEDEMRRLRALHPRSYPETRYPSLTDDPRAPLVALAPYRLGVLGKANFQYGDGGAGGQPPYPETARYAPLPPATLQRAAAFTGDDALARLAASGDLDLATDKGTTILDGAGVAILRSGGAACGIYYGDAVGHQHCDLLDVQLFACKRPFLSDLGYPQSWATIAPWESHWATHNSVWATVPGLHTERLGGRGRLVRSLEVDDLRLVEVEAERWAYDPGQGGWYRPGVRYRRLVGLLGTPDDGALLIDLARLRGGAEHWRCCRGLEGSFGTSVAATRQPGTLADAKGQRGDTSQLAHPDHAALAWMDEVEHLQAGDAWQGTWTSRHAPAAFLDVHQLAASPTARTATARATQIMGRHEESAYDFRALTWRWNAAAEGSTALDLVFEARPGPPALAQIEGIAADAPQASGLALQTRQGRRLRLYWNPGPDRAAFTDGTELTTGLAVRLDAAEVSLGATHWQTEGRTRHRPQAVPRGRITALDRQACSVDVEGLEGISVGQRLQTTTRGFNYRVEAVEAIAGGTRLRLDVTSLLGRGPIVQIEGERLVVDAFILARSGHLHGTRWVAEADGATGVIAAADNPDGDTTRLTLAGKLPDLQRGDWIQAVSYIVGDELIGQGTTSDEAP